MYVISSMALTQHQQEDTNNETHQTRVKQMQIWDLRFGTDDDEDDDDALSSLKSVFSGLLLRV